MKKYIVSFGWLMDDDDNMVCDYCQTFDSKEDAELFQDLIWKNNRKKYDTTKIEEHVFKFRCI
jgi:hypothetical protein